MKHGVYLMRSAPQKISGPLQRVALNSEILAPQVGLEPTTLRLTAECSAIELLRNKRPRIAANYAEGAGQFL